MKKQREYLVEDLDLIRTYFPGARAVALRTPFDLTVSPVEDPWQLRVDTSSRSAWHGDLLWNQ